MKNLLMLYLVFAFGVLLIPDALGQPSVAECQKVYMNHLTSEGYKPYMEGELLMFKKEGTSYAVVVDPENTRVISIATFYTHDLTNKEQLFKALIACNYANANSDFAKAVVSVEDNLIYIGSAFVLNSPKDFSSAFEAILEQTEIGSAAFLKKFNE